ncbi:GNAT family N-acetyltransferase [Chitinophagaceae bacterium LB-8]|jgi:diamine N-acetyltransferase|uniref:GNAT family N-acetyltransferase n=1 Tax=Paraflavisolibacter caeni TaxID=2982496 RepID=A0A9X2XX36_9BACT|nr:GNAT family N-acetyltransferase [Paraflavisolibacter caeni]MCU7550525.1 GNAT family N-acetyltransferase [Paraflavisolibacter caeni]
MSFHIRYATTEDSKLIADLSHQTFYEAFAAQNTKENMDKFLNQQFTKGKLMLEVGAPGNTFLLAQNDHEVVGYAKLRENTEPRSLGIIPALEIARLYVVHHMIGKGVGKLLMSTIFDIARQKNIPAVWLSVWEKNQRALDFYNYWGFEKFDETLFVLGDDVQHDWLMSKKV